MSNRLPSEPATLEGPRVDGQPTTASIFSALQLQGSPFLPSLQRVINAAYREGHKLQGLNTDRLAAPEAFLQTIGDDPQTFVIIIHRRDTYDVIGTATARRHRKYDRQSQSPWIRRLDAEESSQEWELKLLAVDLVYQRQGLGKFLMRLVESEMLRMAKAQISSTISEDNDAIKNNNSAVAGRLKLVLATNKEVNGLMYTKAGYTVDYEIERMNFHISFMSKTVTEM